MKVVTMVISLLIATGSATGAVIVGLGKAALSSELHNPSAVQHDASPVAANFGIRRTKRAAKSRSAAKAVFAKMAPGALPGPSPYSADCYYKGELKKHEEKFVIDECNSYCLCENGELECEKMKCSDAYKRPKPNDYKEKEKERKLKELKKREKEERKKQQEQYRKEEEKRKKEEQRKRREEERQNKNTKPPKPHFHYDDVNAKLPALKPYPQQPYPGHQSPAYPSFNFPNDFFNNIATDNGIYSGNFRDTFASIFRPVFGSGVGSGILREASRIGSGQINFHSGQGSGFGSGYAGNLGGIKSSQGKKITGRKYGTNYRKGHNYDRGYQREDSYGTGFSDYGSSSYGTAAQGGHNYHGGHSGGHSTGYSHSGGGHHGH